MSESSLNTERSSSPIIVALDFPDQVSALNLAKQLNPRHCRVKVGKELFTRAGPAVVDALHSLGFEVFLDLKFHDIPNTTAAAVHAAADMGVWMVNVHASGGRRMMEACSKRLATSGLKTKLIAVTVLTSMEQTDLADIGLDIEPLSQVERLAKLAKESGMDGVVCSAKETPVLKSALGENFELVTPGIRPLQSDTDDQKRVMTPTQALASGSDYLVIGRPITRASDPLSALTAIVKEIDRAATASS